MALGRPLDEHYAAVEHWAPVLHYSIGAPWPCAEPERFDQVWEATVADLTAAGLRVGLATYRGWNDGDRAQAEAIWCLVAHLRPTTVIETGVAHGLTSRVILEGLHRNGNGHLWSVDLPAVDPALHHEIGIAIPADLRPHWTYLEGTSRRWLPGLVRRLRRVDLFLHDSLHTTRNTYFELETVWPALPPGGAAMADDIHRNFGFSRFIEQSTRRHRWRPGTSPETACGAPRSRARRGPDRDQVREPADGPAVAAGEASRTGPAVEPAPAKRTCPVPDAGPSMRQASPLAADRRGGAPAPPGRDLARQRVPGRAVGGERIEQRLVPVGQPLVMGVIRDG